MPNWTSRTGHLPAFGGEQSARAQRGHFGGDVSPGVEVRKGRNGTVVYALKQGVPAEFDPTAELIATLEAQKRARNAL